MGNAIRELYAFIKNKRMAAITESSDDSSMPQPTSTGRELEAFERVNGRLANAMELVALNAERQRKGKQPLTVLPEDNSVFTAYRKLNGKHRRLVVLERLLNEINMSCK